MEPRVLHASHTALLIKLSDDDEEEDVSAAVAAAAVVVVAWEEGAVEAEEKEVALLLLFIHARLPLPPSEKTLAITSPAKVTGERRMGVQQRKTTANTTNQNTHAT